MSQILEIELFYHNKSVSIKSECEDFATLMKQVKENFPNLPNEHYLQLNYLDSDDDHITISCDEDIEAMKDGLETKQITINVEVQSDFSDNEEFEKQQNPQQNDNSLQESAFSDSKIPS